MIRVIIAHGSEGFRFREYPEATSFNVYKGVVELFKTSAPTAFQEACYQQRESPLAAFNVAAIIGWEVV